MSTGMIVVGIIVAAAAGIGAALVKEAADQQARVDQFAATFDNRLIDFTPDYTGMWVLVIVAVLGGVAFIVGFAGRPKEEQPPTV